MESTMLNSPLERSHLEDVVTRCSTLMKNGEERIVGNIKEEMVTMKEAIINSQTSGLNNLGDRLESLLTEQTGILKSAFTEQTGVLKSVLTEQTGVLKELNLNITNVSQTFTKTNTQLTTWNTFAEKRFNRIEDAMMKKQDYFRDSTTELTHLRNFNDVEMRDLERGVTMAVSAQLTNPVVIKEMRYRYKNPDMSKDDLDGLVAGEFKGRRIIVFVEAKHQLERKVTCLKAHNQLNVTLEYWKDLCNGDFEADSGAAEDYRELRVDKFRDREIFLAYGARLFPPESRFFNQMTYPWFRAISDGRGDFIVTFHGPSEAVAASEQS